VNPHDPDPYRGGTFWIGASFLSEGNAALKIYVNGKGGDETEQWARFDQFAARFGALRKWHELKQKLTAMTPLGTAVYISRDAEAVGSLYVHGYGNHVSYYEELLRDCGNEPLRDVFREYTESMLGNERRYPTQSVVCSFCLGSDAVVAAKIEFCGHCLFQSDSEAVDKCLRWLELRGLDTAIYNDLLSVIGGPVSSTASNIHSYVGLGWKQRTGDYSTIYLKPNFV